MFYKLIELSRSLVRCSSNCQRFPDRMNLLKEMIASAMAHQKYTKPDLKHLFVSCSTEEIHKALPLFKKGSLIILLTKELKQMQGMLKENTIKVARSCVSQFEFVMAHRVRRAQQIFSLYSKLWDDKALRVMISRMRKQFLQRGRAFMLGITAAVVVNWDEEMIKDQELMRHSREIEMCHRLKEASLKKSKQDLEPCESCDSEEEIACWEPFVTTGDLTCWKREAPNRKGSGLFCYKMYGAYDDVSANDFLEAFLDIKERKTWDANVVDLHIISSDPRSNSDLLYWETKWPSLFSNRDYIFKRRYKVFSQEKLMVVCNKSSSHPDYPVHSSKTRVTEYWSYMIIKPFTNFSKPGIEFSLTYFDNPGTSLPTAISLWASTTGMPEFMKKLRLAAINVAKTRVLEGEFEEELEEFEENIEEGFDETCKQSIFSKFSFFYSPSEEDSLIFYMLIP